jgi:hypothetical protein
LTSSVRRNSSTDVLCAAAIEKMPALLTTTSGAPPASVSMRSAARAIFVASPTSQTNG